MTLEPNDPNTPSNNEEDPILEQGRRIRALHEIISRPDLSFDEQIDETLRLGCKLLGTEIGKVGRQDPEHNVSEFLNTIVMSDLPAKRGVVIPLDKTYCDITFSSPDTIAISDVADSPFKDHPAVEFLGMHTYIGCSINVHGKKFGTVNFSNRTPRAKPFSEADKDLVDLIGSWISIMMERNLEAKELRESKEAAEKANQAKSAFLANTSHEIRTPLTAIIGFADIALDSDQNMEQRVSALETIRSSSKHLLNLINHILDLSKIEADELDIENKPVEFIKLIREVESIVSGHALRKGINLSIRYDFPLPEIIYSDELRIKQILLNLCNNAIKFTEEGGVVITAAFDKPNTRLTIAVKDSGIGLTAEQITQIFEPFKQADASTTRKFGGTGLGLSLSKRIAKLLNGDIGVESEFAKGSTFWLSLDLNYPNSEAPHLINSEKEIEQLLSKSALKMIVPKLKGKILVAEDNELNQLLIQRYLEKTGAKVDIAENGESAVDLALKNSYDLVFMDMQMPILSGVDAVRKLRDEGFGKPIVMLTANATLEDRSLCEKAGSTDFMTKPIDRNRLYQIAATFLDTSDE